MSLIKWNGNTVEEARLSLAKSFGGGDPYSSRVWHTRMFKKTRLACAPFMEMTIADLQTTFLALEGFRRLSSKETSPRRRKKRRKKSMDTVETYAKVFMTLCGLVRMLLKGGPLSDGVRNTKMRRALEALLFKDEFKAAPQPHEDITEYIKGLDKWFHLLHCTRKTGKGPHKRIYCDEDGSHFFLERKRSETRCEEYDSGSQWALSIRWVKNHLKVS